MGYMFLAAQGRCLLCWISALSLTVSEHWLLLSVRIISFCWSVKYVKDHRYVVYTVTELLDFPEAQ